MSNASSGPRFCSACGAALDQGARFCRACGVPVDVGGRGVPKVLQWGLPAVAVIVVIVAMAITGFQSGRRQASPAPSETPVGTVSAPDISNMTPEERADRLFNRVMRLSSEGKTDSAAFFGPMALGALEALPMDAHRRYDIGVVSLAMGESATATAQADTILGQRPTHLLGLTLAARAADARGDASAANAFRRRLLAAEGAERRVGLGEYADHDADIRAAVDFARKK